MKFHVSFRKSYNDRKIIHYVYTMYSGSVVCHVPRVRVFYSEVWSSGACCTVLTFGSVSFVQTSSSCVEQQPCVFHRRDSAEPEGQRDWLAKISNCIQMQMSCIHLVCFLFVCFPPSWAFTATPSQSPTTATFSPTLIYGPLWVLPSAACWCSVTPGSDVCKHKTPV